MPIARAADFYRTVFEHSTEASLLTAADGRVFRANPAACALLRRTEAEICAAGRQGLVDPASPGLRDLLETRARTGQVRGELTFVRGDGTRFVAEFRSASLFDNENTSEVRNIVTLRDLTEHRATQRALTESQVLLDAIVNNTRDMIWSVDPEEFALQWFNDGLREYFRVHRGMAIDVGMRPEDLFTSDEYIQEWRGLYQRALRERTFTHEYVASSKTRVMQLNLTVLEHDGVVYGISVFSRDITDLKRSERELQTRAEELRASEEQFRAMVEQSPTGTVIFAEGRITYANPAAARIVGAGSTDRIIGRIVMDFVHPDFRARSLERIRNAVATGEASRPAEMIFLGLDGHEIDTESVLLPVTIAGRPSVMVLFNDITERKRATMALTDSESRFRAMVDVTPNGVVIHEDGRLTYANAAAARILGVASPEQLVGRNVKEFIHPDSWPATLDRINRVRDTGQAQPPSEGVYLRADGSAVDVERVATPITIAGKPATLVIFHDITERKAHEKALRESERKYRTLFESADDAILLVHDGRFVDCNAAALRMFGCTRDALLSATPATFSPAVQPDGTPSDIAANRKISLTLSEGPQFFEWEHCRSDGTPFSVEVSLNRLDLGGRVKIQAIVRDVTSRRTAELALRASEERFRAVFSEAPLGIALIDSRTGRILDANRQFGQIAGRSAEELTQIDWMSITHPDDVAEDQRNMALMNAGEISRFHMRKRYRRPDGSHVWISMTVAPIRKPGQEHESHVCMIEDIGARIAAEEELRKLSRAVEQSQASIVITNVKGDIEYVNEAFLLRSGYARDEILAQNPRILNSGETPRGTYDALWQTLRHGETWTGEFINRKKDGSTYVEQAVISPLRQPDGTITHYVAVKEDITDQKRLTAELARHRDHLMELVEERTRELEEARLLAESANKAKSAFLATMSHEIRTPLNGVIAMAEMLALRPLTPEDLDSTKTILRSAHNLLAVINDILDFSKIEAGKLELDVSDISLRQVAEDVLASLHPVAAASDVDLTVDVASAVPSFVRGDATRLRQVVMNLGGNAIKFSRGRTDVRGQVGIFIGVASTAPLRVSLTVRDNGIGMTPETLGRLFTSFTQAEASTTRRFGGTGLGLAITKRLVDLMEGTIEVETAPGTGSTFTVILPVAAVAPATPAYPGRAGLHRRGAEPVAAAYLRTTPLSLDEARAQGRLILVAEDDSMNQKVILQQLGLLGYAGQIAVDGEEALRLWRAGAYAMLLSDLHMPNRDGYSLAAAIRDEEKDRGTHLPIIALTANALHGEADRATAAGMDGYLTKPVPLATLREVLAKWIPPADGRS
ncbi:MAG TPA: PAS domain S-box protein [Gemmatimonadaceae bacterium]|jgi:PAS domain S-box-containing protein